jgi:hypothetical protein
VINAFQIKSFLSLSQRHVATNKTIESAKNDNFMILAFPLEALKYKEYKANALRVANVSINEYQIRSCTPGPMIAPFKF